MNTTYKLFIIAILFSACRNSAPTASDNAAGQERPEPATGISFTETQFSNAGIALGPATVAEVGTTLRLSGEIDVAPSGLVSISVPYGGFVKETHLIPGQPVRQGQLLAVLEHPEYIRLQQDYLDTETRIRMASLEYERQKELAAGKVSGRKAAEQARTELDLLLNSRAALTRKLRMIHIDPAQLKTGRIRGTIRITSPINGIVRQVHVNVGKMVTPEDVLFELLDRDQLHLKLNAFEHDLAALAEGQAVDFTARNGGRSYRAQIMHIGTGVEGDKTIPVHADIRKPAYGLIPGMFVTATVRTASSKMSTLPGGAVVNVEGKEFVFVHEGNYRFRRVPVTTGAKNGDRTAVELPEDLKGSDQIVVRGAHNILAKELNAGEEE